MNGYGTVALFALMTVGVCTQAIAADVEIESGNVPPVRFHHVHPTIIIHQGMKPFQITGGGTFPLDKLRKFVCKSATGCVITAKVSVNYDSYVGMYASTFVDGVAMNPPGINTGDQLALAQESVVVPNGSHTIQSEVIVGQDAVGNVTSFEAEYAIYDHSQN